MIRKTGWLLISLAALLLNARAGERTPPPWEKPLRVGRYLYLENCSVCHEINKPKRNKFGPNLFGLFQSEKMPLSRVKPTDELVADKIKNGGFIMPAFRDYLTDDQIEKLIAYIRSKH